jgi:hypothetical protein
MTSQAREVLRQALGLPVDQPADVAAELLAGLDDAAPSDRAEVEAAGASSAARPFGCGGATALRLQAMLRGPAVGAGGPASLMPSE